MNIKLATILFLFLSGISLFAQDKTVHKAVPKGQVLGDAIYLGEHGVLLKSRQPVGMGKSDKTIWYYNSIGDLVWEKSIAGSVGSATEILSVSPSGEIVYFIEMKGFPGKTHYITQIKKNGEVKNVELEGKIEFGFTLLAVFCDDQYLYYLASQNGDEQNDIKKSTDKVILNRFSKDGLTHKRFVLELPIITPGEASTFWAFIGQRGDEKYISSKQLDFETGKSAFQVMSFNSEGQVTLGPTITFALDGKFNRPALNVSRPREIITDVDYSTKMSQSTVPNMGTTVTTRSVPTWGGFAFIQFDALNNNFYIYGLTGPKPFKKVGPVYDGFFVAKYDSESNPLWKLQQPASEKLMNEGAFRVHALPSDRDIALKILPGNKLNFSIHFYDKLFEYEISSEGKLLGARDKGDALELTGNMFSLTEKLKSEEFIKKSKAASKSRMVDFTNAITSTGELVLKTDFKESTFDLYYFKK